MALIRWQPFQEVEALRHQMDQVFNELAATERYSTNWKPAVELQDTDENLVLRAELPGIEGKNINIQVTREAVAISGEHRYQKKAEDKGVFRSEFRYGKFQRVISLPVAIQNDQAKADFNNGILTLTLPKVTEARRTVVKLNLAQGNTAAPQLDEKAAAPAVNADSN